MNLLKVANIKIALILVLLLSLLNTIRIIPTLTKDSNSDDNTSVLRKHTATEKEKETPVVLKDDFIYGVRTSFVIPEYKLIFFTFPKVACSEWKRMFMRIYGNPNWCKASFSQVHHRGVNKIRILGDYDTEVATAMMTSPAWTKVAFFREPKERVLSSFLDKAVNTNFYMKYCCEKLPEDKRKNCEDHSKEFGSFLHHVTKYPKECTNRHWIPQVSMMDAKWWPYIDFIGYQNTIEQDSKRLMQMLTSTKDPVPNRTLYERYGSSGWGSEEGCENRTHAFMHVNTAEHKTGADSQMKEWYTPETEKIVEQYWAVEWAQEKVKFDKVKLFPDS